MITILHGDNLQILPTLPERSVQAVMTSPPYFALRDYGIPPSEWPAVSYAPLAGVPPVEVSAARCCLGLEDDPLAYVGHLVHVFRLLRPVLRDDGVIWLNLGDSYAQPSKWGGGKQNVGKNGHSIAGGYSRARRRSGLKSKDLYGIPWRAALALQADGWYLRSDVVWEKPTAMPESVDDRPTRSHEYLFLLAKSERYYYDNDAIREPQTGGAHSRGSGLTPKTAPGHHERIKANASFHRSTSVSVVVPGGRNRRSIWRIAAGRYPEAHFATFPEALVEPCILAGTSVRGACPSCGAPWWRLIEAIEHVNGREAAHQPDRQNSTKTDSTGWAPTRRATDDWQPTCACDAGDPVPCVVLDPFVGSGTALRVAERLGRNSIGIEINDSYIDLAQKRTDGVQKELVL